MALFIAICFSAWVVVLFFRRGNAPFERLGTTFGGAILLYFCAAIVIGPLVGLLLPLARAGRLGAALLGTVAAFALYGMAISTLHGFTSWTIGKALGLLALAMFAGAPMGLVYKRLFGARL